MSRVGSGGKFAPPVKVHDIATICLFIVKGGEHTQSHSSLISQVMIDNGCQIILFVENQWSLGSKTIHTYSIVYVLNLQHNLT